MAEASAEVVRIVVCKRSLSPKSELDSFRQFRRSPTLAILVPMFAQLGMLPVALSGGKYQTLLVPEPSFRGMVRAQQRFRSVPDSGEPC